jgi:hypothetical protein
MIRDEATTTTVVPVLDLHANTPAVSEERNDGALTIDGDELGDNALMHTMLCEAAADSEQPSLDADHMHWQLCWSGFSGKAVENAYQAGQASVRAMGIAVEAALFTFWYTITTRSSYLRLGNATKTSTMLGINFPVIAVLLLIAAAPFTIQLIQEWKPVKHRKLVYMTSCATATIAFLILLVALVWLATEQGHTVSGPDLVVWNAFNLMGPLLMILLLRPSALLISATCTVSGALFCAISYYSDTFVTGAVSIVSGFVFTGTTLMMWFVFESTNRTSFVHRLSAMRHAVATMRTAEAAMRRHALLMGAVEAETQSAEARTIGGVVAILREGRWDEKAWSDAEDTREAAVGWLLAAAGGHLAANGNELAQKLVEDGFDTWTAMDLTEQELKEFGFSRGGARSFATECRGMRGARGIFDRPPQKN